MIGFAAALVVAATWIIVAAARQFPPPTPAPGGTPREMAEPESPCVALDLPEAATHPEAPEKQTRADSTAESEARRVNAEQAAPKPAPRRAAPVAKEELPPFPKTVPPLGMSPMEPPSGPPPNVLWLAGVIQGEPSLAMLRRGDNRYLAKEGDVIEGRYRVVEISPSQVKLQRGGRRITLRLGDYR